MTSSSDGGALVAEGRRHAAPRRSTRTALGVWTPHPGICSGRPMAGRTTYPDAAPSKAEDRRRMRNLPRRVRVGGPGAGARVRRGAWCGFRFPGLAGRRCTGERGQKSGGKLREKPCGKPVGLSGDAQRDAHHARRDALREAERASGAACCPVGSARALAVSTHGHWRY